MTTELPPWLLFLDLETTGLNVKHDLVLEVGAMLVSTGSLDTEADFEALVRTDELTFEGVRSWPDEVRQMHTANGLLLAMIEDRGRPIDYCHNALATMLANANVQTGDVALAGPGVSHFEAGGWMARYFPRVRDTCKYWTLDTSVVRRTLQLAGRNVNDAPIPHRALADCRMGLNDLRAYRELFDAFLPPVIDWANPRLAGKPHPVDPADPEPF